MRQRPSFAPSITFIGVLGIAALVAGAGLAVRAEFTADAPGQPMDIRNGQDVRPMLQSSSGRTPREAGIVDSEFDSADLVAADGALAREKVPEWIPVLGGGGENGDKRGRAGYVRREDLFPHLFGGTVGLLPAPGTPMTSAPHPVADADGRLVGHMYQGVGFVSLEESQKPDFKPHPQTPPTTVTRRAPGPAE